MSDRALWLADVLRGAGLNVYEMPGWRERGKALPVIQGVVWHHTATGPNWSDGHVAALLRDGRRDLAGPLSQLGLERDGTFVVVAAGRANHNGYGTWGNSSLGIEAYNDGVGEPWPAAQVAAYDRGTAAILAHLGHRTDRMKGHRETDPGRKIDPAGIDMDQSRQRVAALLTYRPPSKDWSDMATKQEIREVVDEALAEALGPKSKLDVASKVRSIFRHTVEGPDPKPGADRKDMTAIQRIIDSLRRLEDKS